MPVGAPVAGNAGFNVPKLLLDEPPKFTATSGCDNTELAPGVCVASIGTPEYEAAA